MTGNDFDSASTTEHCPLPELPECLGEQIDEVPDGQRLEKLAGSMLNLVTYWYPYLRRCNEDLFRTVFGLVREYELCKGAEVFKIRPSIRPICVASSILLQMRAIDSEEETVECVRDEVWCVTFDEAQARDEKVEACARKIWAAWRDQYSRAAQQPSEGSSRDAVNP